MYLGLVGTIEGESIRRFAVRDFVVPEEGEDLETININSRRTSTYFLFMLGRDVFVGIPSSGKRAIHGNSDDLPVGFTLRIRKQRETRGQWWRGTIVNHGNSAQNLNGDNVSGFAWNSRKLAHVNRIVITKGLCALILVSGILPGLRKRSVVEWVRVCNVTKLAILCILLDRVQRLTAVINIFSESERSVRGNLKFGLGALGNLTHKVGDALLLVHPKGNVVERRNRFSVFH